MTGPGADTAPARRALESLGVPLSLAEAHGLACGLLCSRTASGAKSRWFAELLDAAGLEPASLAGHAGAVRDVDAWFEATRAALHGTDLEFEPALPDDDEPLARRIDALGDFCAGLTYGVGLGAAARGNRPLPGDVAELLADFQSIDALERGAAAGHDATEGGPDAEADYVELVEYVRVGVLVMLEELRPAAAGPPGAAAAGKEAGRGAGAPGSAGDGADGVGGAVH